MQTAQAAEEAAAEARSRSRERVGEVEAATAQEREARLRAEAEARAMQQVSSIKLLVKYAMGRANSDTCQLPQSSSRG